MEKIANGQTQMNSINTKANTASLNSNSECETGTASIMGSYVTKLNILLFGNKEKDSRDPSSNTPESAKRTLKTNKYVYQEDISNSDSIAYENEINDAESHLQNDSLNTYGNENANNDTIYVSDNNLSSNEDDGEEYIESDAESHNELERTDSENEESENNSEYSIEPSDDDDGDIQEIDDSSSAEDEEHDGESECEDSAEEENYSQSEQEEEEPEEDDDNNDDDNDGYDEEDGNVEFSESDYQSEEEDDKNETNENELENNCDNSDCEQGCDGDHYIHSSDDEQQIHQEPTSIHSTKNYTNTSQNDNSLRNNPSVQTNSHVKNALSTQPFNGHNHKMPLQNRQASLPLSLESVTLTPKSHISLERNNNKYNSSVNSNIMGELRTAIDARVQRSNSLRDMPVHKKIGNHIITDETAGDNLSKLDVKEREARRKERRARLRTLELKREQMLDEVREGTKDSVIDAMYDNS